MEEQENMDFWNEAEREIRKAGETTIIDFYRQLFPSEYELEYTRYLQEWQNIQQKMGYRLTSESKKKVLEDELELTIKYLEDEEEGEFRQIFGDLSQVTLDKVIDKIKLQTALIQKSSMWQSLEPNAKRFFLSVKNLPSALIKKDMSFREAYKVILDRLNLKVLSERDKKQKPITINRQLLEFINRLFYDHFQVELNKTLQAELKNFLEPKEYKSNDNSDSDKAITIPIKIKSVKKGREIDLEQTHYAILIDYFQKSRVFLSDESHISDVSASKAMQILSGYHYDNIRKKLGSLEFSKDQRIVVKEKLQEVIILIDRDLKKK